MASQEGRLLAVAIVIGLSLIGVIADLLIKQASIAKLPFRDANLYGGMAVYALTALGWVLALQHLKLATVGLIYGVSTVLFLAVGGWLFYNETLRPLELVAIGFGLASIVLLARFS